MFGDVIPIEDELLAALYNGGNEEREMILETAREDWFVSGSGKILFAKAVADLEAGREPSIAASFSIPDKEVKDRLATLSGKLSPTVFSLRSSVKAAAERAQKMQVVFACNVAEEEIKSGEPPLDVAARLEAKLRDLGCEGDDEIKTIGDAASGLLTDMERAAKRKTLFSGISSGLSGLDVLTGGFRNGQMIVVAARTGEGKTALASQLLLHAARNKWDEDKQDWAAKGYVTCLVELEMTSAEVAQRCVAHLGGPQMWKMRDAGKLTDKDLADARAALTTLQNLPFFVDAPSRMRLGALRAKARSWKRRLGMEMLCVDLIGKVNSDGRERDRWREVATVSHGLKALAKELNIVVIAIAQLNRDASGEEEAGLHHIRESGDIEQDADVVLLLTTSKEDEKVKTLRVAKCRSGLTGRVPLVFDGNTQRFKELVKEAK